MRPEIQAMGVDELLALQRDIRQELCLRLSSERRALLNEFNKKAKALGLTLDELVNGGCGNVQVAKVIATHAHPENPELTWNGVGDQPAWVNDWLESGKSLKQLHYLALLEYHFDQ